MAFAATLLSGWSTCNQAQNYSDWYGGTTPTSASNDWYGIGGSAQTYGSGETQTIWLQTANPATNMGTVVYYQHLLGAPTAYQYQYQYQNVIGGIVSGITYTETAEEKVEREKQAAIRQQAINRAEELLVSLLNDPQRQQYAEHKHFDVQVAGKIYRLKPYDRVRLLDEAGKAKIAYCIHPDHIHGLPAADVMLAQKLLLETDEAHFLKTANASIINPNGDFNQVIPPYPVPVEPDALAEAELEALTLAA